MKSFLPVALSLLIALSVSGCNSNDEQQKPQSRAAQVKAMQVIQRDTPLTSEFAGQIVAADEVKVQSKISANVIEKFCTGGQFVQQGQLLYKLDDRNYQAAVLKAQADLAQSEATLKNAQLDLYRNEQLFKDEAIAEQVVTTQAAQVRAYEAMYAANEALLHTAMVNLADTEIYAPMSGQLSVDDVAVGTFVSAGQTSLVTIGSTNPIFAKFSVSEADYLKFLAIQEMKSEPMKIDVTLTLTDGSEYPLIGQIVEQDRELADNTGSLTIKAIFSNPDGKLLPGMFARVKLSGDTRPNSILVPQRSVQQLLGKSFVMVVGSDSKSEARTVKLGDKVGSYYIIEEGVTPADTVIVEGLTNLQEGVDLNVTMVSAGDMGFTLSEINSAFNEDANLK